MQPGTTYAYILNASGSGADSINIRQDESGATYLPYGNIQYSEDGGGTWQDIYVARTHLFRIWGSGLIDFTFNDPTPANNGNSLFGDNVTINLTVSGITTNMKNITLWINDTLNETVAVSPAAIENTTLFSKNFSLGAWSYKFTACRTDDVCENSSERVVDIVRFVENSWLINQTSAETAVELISVNVSISELHAITAATLFYGSNTYTGKYTNMAGEFWNLSAEIDVPLGVVNNTVIFEMTIDGTKYNTTNNYQKVNETIFTLCNATWTDDFLNITFKEEGNLINSNASVNTATFAYYLGSGNIVKNYTFTNATLLDHFRFCASPETRTFNVDPIFQYKQGTLFPQRIWDPGFLTYTDTMATQILYLLHSDDGIYVTFQVINSADQVLEGVYINATRNVDGTDVVVGSGNTGASGTLTLWLNPDFSHDFVAYLEGYDQFISSFAPTQSEYTISLGSEAANETFDCYEGIDFDYGPPVATLINDTTYDFYFNLTSTYWNVDNFGFELTNSSGDSLGAVHVATNGGDAVLSFNTGNHSDINLNYFWEANGTNCTGTVPWMVLNSEATEFGLDNFFTRVNTYVASGLFGVGPFGLAMIVFVIIFMTVGLFSWKFGITNTFAMSLMLFGLVALFDTLGFLDGINATGINYFPTIFMGFISIAFLIREGVR